jgi:ribA/ribD-fused uncharacterized protein
MQSKMTTAPEDNRILFYKRDREAFGFLSNFHSAPVAIDGEVWPTVEHYYQAQKSIDPAYRQAIREAVTPGRAKRLGASPTAPRRQSRQSWFRRNKTALRADWQEARLEVMRRAVRAKFLQNRDLAELLLATGTAELLEDSATDSFWGVGPDGRGLNGLGRVLMEVREELAAAREREGNMPSAKEQWEFGWDCPESPDGVCHYFSKEGKVELADGRSVPVPANHDATNESQEWCIFCKEPKERK